MSICHELMSYLVISYIILIPKITRLNASLHKRLARKKKKKKEN